MLAEKAQGDCALQSIPESRSLSFAGDSPEDCLFKLLKFFLHFTRIFLPNQTETPERSNSQRTPRGAPGSRGPKSAPFVMKLLIGQGVFEPPPPRKGKHSLEMPENTGKISSPGGPEALRGRKTQGGGGVTHVGPQEQQNAVFCAVE